MDDNMTIGEMIEAYANFGNTREYYDLYKEAVSIDLKVRYALTEAYMQESSVEYILEGNDLWGSITKGVVWLWDKIMKWLRKIWYHLSRFFHSIFKRTDKFYKLETAYKNIVRECFRRANERTKGSNSRRDVEQMVAKAVCRIARIKEFYAATSEYENIDTALDGDGKDEIIKFLKDTAGGLVPDKTSSTEWSSFSNIGRKAKQGLEKTVTEEIFNNKSTKSSFMKNFTGSGHMKPNVQYSMQFRNKDATSTSRYGGSIADLVRASAFVYTAVNDNKVGFKGDPKKVDEFCRMLDARPLRDKSISTFADVLNATYIFSAPPISLQIPESFNMLIGKTETLISKLKRSMESDKSDKIDNELAKWLTDLRGKQKKMGDEYSDVIIDDAFDKKIKKTQEELDKVIKEYSDRNGAGGKIDDSDFGTEIEFKVRADKNDKESVISGLAKSGRYRGDVINSDQGKVDVVQALNDISAEFSKVTAGVSNMITAISIVAEFRKAFAENVLAFLDKKIKITEE